MNRFLTLWLLATLLYAPYVFSQQISTEVYHQRIVAGLSEESLEAARDESISPEQLFDEHGIRTLIAALNLRYPQEPTPVSEIDDVDESLQRLGLPPVGQSLPANAQHMLPPDVSQAAFEEGVRIGKSPYLPEASFKTLAEAIEFAEGHRPEISTLMSHHNLALFTLLLTEGRSREESLSPEEFQLQLESGSIAVTQDGRGRAELNTVDGIKWANTRIDGSELAFVWENASRVHPRSKHSQRIIASQHLVGGKTRSDNQRGRDVIKVRYDWNDDGDLIIESVGYYPRHKFLSKAWIRDFALYDLTMPSMADVLVLGLPAGIWQAGVTSAFDIAKTGQVNWKIATFTFLFGGVYCGVFSTNLRRLTNEFSRSELQRLITNIIVTSIPFAVIYKVLSHESGSIATGIASLNPFSIEGLLLYIGLSVHFWVNNVTKGELQAIVSDRTHARVNTQPMLGVRQSNLEQTLTYNAISFPARIADLATYMRFTISRSMNIQSSGGKVLLLGLFPFARWAKVLHKEWLEKEKRKTNPDFNIRAREAREKWNDSFLGALVGLPVGTFMDLTLAGESFFRGASKAPAPKGDLLDMFRLFNFQTRTLEGPSDHFARIGLRWQTQAGSLLKPFRLLASACSATKRGAKKLFRAR